MFDTHHHHNDLRNGIYNWGLNEKLPSSYFCVGLHPKDIDDNVERYLEQIRVISQNEKCVAIGECGLDGLISIDESLQEKVFEAQILWANEIGKPVIVHCVRRFSQLLKFQKIAQVPMIIHGFCKKKSIADEMLNKGFYLSFGKALLYRKELQEVARNMPIDKIFLETDTAEISIDEVYQKLAEIKNLEITDLQNQIKQNIEKVFEIKW